MKRLVLCAWILCASPVFATTYYVSKSGSGSTCSMASPCLTIATGVGKLSAGDTLIIGAGTYTEALADSVPSGIDQNNPTTIEAASGETVVVDGIDATWNDVIHVHNKSYIDFINIGVDGRQVVTGFSPIMVKFGTTNTNSSEAGAHYIRWIGGEITSSNANASTGEANCIDVGSNFVGAANPNSNNTVSGAHIHGCVGTCGVQGCHCIYLTAASTIIEGNELNNCDGWGIHTNSSLGADSNIARNNIIHDTGGPGIRWATGDNNVAYNNVIYNFGLITNQAGITITDSSGNSAYNNTIYGGTGYCIWSIGSPFGSATNSNVRNNICYNNSNNIVQIDSGTAGTVGSNMCSSGCGQSGDPLFVDANGGNFSLQCHSPAIDTGAAIGTVADDFIGTLRPVDGGACGDGTSGYDIGAYEYIASQAPPPPPPYTGIPSKKPRLRIRIK